MNKKSIESSVCDIVADIIKSTQYEMVDVEYVKEGPFKYLRVYVDKPGGITIDDCSEISRSLNKKLDEVDLIDEQYFLEVSSPGIDRPFKKESDFIKNINNEVEVKLYSPVDGVKNMLGILLEKNESNVVIGVNGKNIAIDLKNISKINRAVEVI